MLKSPEANLPQISNYPVTASKITLCRHLETTENIFFVELERKMPVFRSAAFSVRHMVAADVTSVSHHSKIVSQPAKFRDRPRKHRVGAHKSGYCPSQPAGPLEEPLSGAVACCPLYARAQGHSLKPALWHIAGSRSNPDCTCMAAGRNLRGDKQRPGH